MNLDYTETAWTASITLEGIIYDNILRLYTIWTASYVETESLCNQIFSHMKYTKILYLNLNNNDLFYIKSIWISVILCLCSLFGIKFKFPIRCFICFSVPFKLVAAVQPLFKSTNKSNGNIKTLPRTAGSESEEFHLLSFKEVLHFSPNNRLFTTRWVFQKTWKQWILLISVSSWKTAAESLKVQRHLCRIPAATVCQLRIWWLNGRKFV